MKHHVYYRQIHNEDVNKVSRMLCKYAEYDSPDQIMDHECDDINRWTNYMIARYDLANPHTFDMEEVQFMNETSWRAYSLQRCLLVCQLVQTMFMVNIVRQ